MPLDKFELIRRIKDVESEQSALRFSVEHARRSLDEGKASLPRM